MSARSEGRSCRTPIFSFDTGTPSRDRSSRDIRNSTARDILSSIVRPGTPATTAATEVTTPTVSSEINASTPVTPSTTQTQSDGAVTPFSSSTSMNQGSR